MQMSDSKVKLISTARHYFHGRWLRANDVFYATEEEASELMSKPIGFAVRAPDDDPDGKPKRANTYRRRDMKVE
jgi:hypothetical protein